MHPPSGLWGKGGAMGPALPRFCFCSIPHQYPNTSDGVDSLRRAIVTFVHHEEVTTTLKVLVTAPINPDALAIVEQHFPVTKAILISTEDLKKIIGDYDILLMRTDKTIDRDLLEQAKKLKIVAVASIGLDHVDLDAAKEKGVLVFNSPGGNSQSVAELAIGLMISLARKVAVADHDVRQGIWERSKYGGVELEGKTLGLIAIGNIGTRVAKMAQAIGMNVIAVDPYVLADRAAQANIELTTLDDVISRSDVISIHSPLTKETHHLINADKLAKMKKSAMLINTARGPIIDEQ